MSITSIKVTDTTVIITYDKERDNGSATITVRCTDKIGPKFLEAFGECGTVVSKILGLGPYIEPKHVSKVSIKPGDDGNDQIMVLCVREITGSNRPLNLNSPLLEGAEFPELQNAVTEVKEQAEKYMAARNREQLMLFGEKAAA